MRLNRRTRWLVAVLLGLLSLYALAGFVAVPYVIEAYVVPAVAEQLKHPVILRNAGFNPFLLALRLDGLEIQEQDGTPILGLETFLVDLRASTLFWQTIGFDEIRFVMPFVTAKVDHEGELNLLALVPPADEETLAQEQEAEPQLMMPVEITLLEINRGILEYSDESKAKPVSFHVVSVHLLLRDFSTRLNGENAYSFTAEIGKGETLAWRGTLLLQPLESDGTVSLSGIQLRTLFQAVQDRFRFDVQQGEMDLFGGYHFDMRDGEPRLNVKSGKLALRDLALSERGFVEPVVEIPAFSVQGVQVDLQNRTVQVREVQSADARIRAWTDRNGRVNLQPLFAPVDADVEPKSKEQPSEGDEESSSVPWSVVVEQIGIQNYQANFEDRTLDKPAYTDVEALDVTVRDVTIPFKKPLPVELSLKLNQTGQVDVGGQISVAPMVAELDLALKQVGLRPFQPYLDRFLNADLRDGAIELQGSVRYEETHAKRPLLRFQGNLAVNDLSVTDRSEFQDVVSWKSFAINRLALDVEPTTVKIGEIVWQEPAVEMVVEKDGTLNLGQLVAQSGEEAQAETPKAKDGEQAATKPSPAVPVTVDQVKLINLTAIYRDASIEPAVKTGITKLSGEIKGLSSKQLAKADVNLAGKIDNAAPIKIEGKINPLSEDAYTDLVLTLGGMDLTPAGPYSGKYVGFRLSRGKLSLDLKYKISQKLLEAENLVLVDQLTFGEKTESPDATTLPVPLLVALLQDRQGRIEIDLPIRGDLSDPDFQYGGVVLSALVNLLGKIAASPFTLIGKLIPEGVSEEDLQFVQFQPGSAALLIDEITKLDALAKALDERQGLRLDVAGTADAKLDRDAFRVRKLDAQLMALKRTKAGKDKEEPEELSPEEELKLVEQLYAKLPGIGSEQDSRQSEDSEKQQPTLEEMKQRLLSEIQIPQAELEGLARERAEAVRDHLVEHGGLTNDRVFLIETDIAATGYDLIRTQLGLGAAS